MTYSPRNNVEVPSQPWRIIPIPASENLLYTYNSNTSKDENYDPSGRDRPAWSRHAGRSSFYCTLLVSIISDEATSLRAALTAREKSPEDPTKT